MRVERKEMRICAAKVKDSSRVMEARYRVRATPNYRDVVTILVKINEATLGN